MESYDKDNGYIFLKDGVRYDTTCFATGIPVLGADKKPDPDPDSLPPDVASSQEDCGDILVYRIRLVNPGHCGRGQNGIG